MIPVWAVRLLNIANTIVNIVLGIQSAQAEQATATGVAALEGALNDVIDTVDSPVYGNQQINTNVLAIITDLTADFDALTAQLDAIQATLAAGVPATSIPPSAITDIGNEVWGYPIPTTGTLAYVHLQDAGTYATQKSNFQEVIDSPRGASWWRLLGSYNVDGQADISPSVTFDLDLSTILPTDATAADWVQRVYTTAPWTVFDNGMAGIPDPGVNSYFWIVWITPDVWAILQNALFGAGSALNLAPVWPGLAGVTLGTPVDISLTFTIDGPLAGVIVALTAYPTLKGHYDYDDYIQALKIGALTFVSDNGDAEYVQALGFMNEVYVPKNMTQAASCKFRTVSGVTGTVTPFTIP